MYDYCTTNRKNSIIATFKSFFISYIYYTSYTFESVLEKTQKILPNDYELIFHCLNNMTFLLGWVFVR